MNYANVLLKNPPRIELGQEKHFIIIAWVLPLIVFRHPENLR